MLYLLSRCPSAARVSAIAFSSEHSMISHCLQGTASLQMGAGHITGITACHSWLKVPRVTQKLGPSPSLWRNRFGACRNCASAVSIVSSWSLNHITANVQSLQMIMQKPAADIECDMTQLDAVASGICNKLPAHPWGRAYGERHFAPSIVLALAVKHHIAVCMMPSCCMVSIGVSMIECDACRGSFSITGRQV